jgi:hypothetical protein
MSNSENSSKGRIKEISGPREKSQEASLTRIQEPDAKGPKEKSLPRK